VHPVLVACGAWAASRRRLRVGAVGLCASGWCGVAMGYCVSRGDRRRRRGIRGPSRLWMWHSCRQGLSEPHGWACVATRWVHRAGPLFHVRLT